MSDMYSTDPPHPCERLARIEGESNFLSLLAGIEAGRDTTEDMAALSYARNRGVVVEALEARWSGSVRHRVALCHLVLGTMQVADKDKTWVRAAILDGYALFVGKEVRDSETAAKMFKVRKGDYLAVRKYAERFLLALAMDAERPWIRARFGN